MTHMRVEKIISEETPILPTWFEEGAGHNLLCQQTEMLGNLIPDQFYPLGLQYGHTQINTMQSLNVDRSLYCDRAFPASGGLDFVSLPEALPLPESSVDLAVMLHTLDYCDDPHHTLREIAQTLSPEGVFVLSGFHPYSLWGARKKFGSKHAPFDARFISRAQAQDWLELLGFQSLTGAMMNYQFPQLNERWREKLRVMNHFGDRWWPTLGAVYIIVARKKVYSGISMKRTARRIARWLPELKPSHRVSQTNRAESQNP